MYRKISGLALAVLTISLFACESDGLVAPSQNRDLVSSSTVPESSYAWLQGFETDRSGWFDFGGTLSLETSGYASGGYADGVTSAHGNGHARLDGGAFTRWGGYLSSSVPFITEIDVYLDTNWAAANPDVRFDWSSAIYTTSGNHRRDFIFNAGTDPSGASRFVVSASNNAPGWPSNPGRDPQYIEDSGWYTFRHTFRNNAGTLAVDLEILDHGGTVVADWTLSDPSDDISLIGGNGYGWFVTNGIPDLAIDQSGRLSVPYDKNDCKKGGWKQYGFKNQGQCIKFVNTGKDSR